MLTKFILLSCIIPLFGALPSLPLLSLGWLALGLCRFFMGMHWLIAFGYLIPSFIGAFYFSTVQNSTHFTRSRIACALLALVCMAIFMTDAIGFYAAPYALYWLIPTLIALQPYQNSFISALGATLTVHALGSVQWLLTGVISSEQWLALIPVVAYERLLCAAVIAGVYALTKNKVSVTVLQAQLVGNALKNRLYASCK